METTRRRFLQSEPNNESGKASDELKAFTKEPVSDDAIAGTYGNVRINPTTSGPYSDSQEITISLASDSFDVTEFENSFIHLKLRIRMRFLNAPVVEGTDAFAEVLKQNQFVFVGLKCSSHILRNYSFKFNEVPLTSTMQSSAIYENFLFSSFRAKGEIANKKYVYSPYEEVSKLDNSYCGMYIPIGELVNGSYRELDLIIPYDTLLAMEAFDLYPNRIFGDLKIVFNTSSEAFVHTEINPITSIRKGIMSGRINKTVPHLSDVLSVDKDSFEYTRAFEQIGIASPYQFVSGWDAENKKLQFSTMPEFTPFIDEIVCQECWVDCKGFRLEQPAIQTLRSYFSAQPFTVPAQKIETNTFPNGPEKSGLRTAMNVRLNHTTDIELLLPTDSRQRTVFRNPCHDNFQLQIGNQRFPEQLISTLSPQFHEQQIQASDFDSIFEANDEYEHSLTDPLVDEHGELKPLTDNTCFIPIYQVERSGSGSSELWFSGIHRLQEKIELNSKPLYPEHDIYYKGAQTPAPILCSCQETYWIFRIVDGHPNCQYITTEDYETGYNNPSIESVKLI